MPLWEPALQIKQLPDDIFRCPSYREDPCFPPAIRIDITRLVPMAPAVVTPHTVMPPAPLSQTKQKMLRGEMYHAFIPELVADRGRAKAAMRRYNAAVGEVSRREEVRLWRE